MSYHPGMRILSCRVLDEAEESGEPPHGARKGGRVHAVRVLGERPQRELEVDHPLHAQAHDWPALAVYLPVLPDDRVGLEELRVPVDVRLEVRAPDLLLALEAELHVAGRLAVRPDVGLDQLEPGDELPLVVRDAPAVEPPVAYLWLEGRGLPQLERDLGLDVVVVVEQDGLARLRRPDLAVDQRGGAGELEELRRPADLLDHRLHEVRALRDPLLPRGDAGLGGEPDDVLHEPSLVVVDVVGYLLVEHHQGLLSALFPLRQLSFRPALPRISSGARRRRPLSWSRSSSRRGR